MRFQQRKARIAWGVLIAALTAFAVFVLPFFFPPSVPSRSPAYAAGASNRAAEIAVGLLSLAVACAALRFGTMRDNERRNESLSRRWLWAALALMCSFQLLLGAAVLRFNDFYGESEFFLTQLEKGLHFHLVLYRDLQFFYGPALYWWPLLWIKALRPLGLSTLFGYLVALVLMQAAGVALLFYTVRALPLRASIQRFAFAAIVLGSLSPTMGLNYSLFRFVVPMACMVLLSRRSSLGAVCVAAGAAALAGFAVSAEIGIASLGGVLGYAICAAITGRVRWLVLIPAVLMGAAIFLAFTPSAYLQMLRDAGTGAYDLLLTPEPRTILLLVALVGLAPLAVARAARHALQSGGIHTAAMLAGIYGTALGLMPVALGRCDSVHEFFFSLGAILLSLVALEPAEQRSVRFPALLWIACIALWVVMSQVANLHLYRPSLASLAHPQSSPAFDVAALQRALNGERVFLVENLSLRTDEQLLDRGLVVPGFFCNQLGIYRKPAEERRIADMRAANFALVPAGGVAAPEPFEEGSIARWKKLGLVYHQRRTAYVPGELTDQELASNWIRIATISDEILYRKLQ